MLDRLSEFLHKVTSGWLVLTTLLLALLFNLVIMPGVGAKIMAFSGNTGPIDMLFFYTPEMVFSMIKSYGEEGRTVYRTFTLTLDVLYPLIYTAFFATAISWLFRRGFSPNSEIQQLNLIPLITLGFDLLENLSVATMLTIFPSQPAILARIAAVCTAGKWIFVGVNLILVCLGLIGVTGKYFRRSLS